MNRPDLAKATPSQQMELAVLTETINRRRLSDSMGSTHGGVRDVYKSLGYKTELTFSDYWLRFKRQDVATRIIDAPPAATWSNRPQLVVKDQPDHGLNQAWLDMQTKHNILPYLSRVDRLSRVGKYGVLLIGLKTSGTSTLSSAVKDGTGLELLYLKPYTELSADIQTLDDDTKSANYGLPKTYSIALSGTFDNASGAPTAESSTTQSVHFTRVLHVAENRTESEYLGTPALENVFNRLMDLDKTVGGSAEMYWKGALPGYAFKVDPEAKLTDVDKEEMADEIDEWMHHLKRQLNLQGVDVQEFTPQTADPTSSVDVVLKMISAGTGIPLRILTGSERGELASSQDEANWNKRVDERRNNYATPFILRPFIDKLMSLGLLPSADSYEIVWPKSQQLSEMEKAEVGKIKAEALKMYTDAPEADLVLPIENFLADILGYSSEEVKEITSAIEVLETEADAAADDEQAEERQLMLEDEDRNHARSLDLEKQRAAQQTKQVASVRGTV